MRLQISRLKTIYDCIDDLMVVSIDDLLIFKKNYKDHMRHVENVLQKLRQHNLYVLPKIRLVLYRDGIYWLYSLKR